MCLQCHEDNFDFVDDDQNENSKKSSNAPMVGAMITFLKQLK